MKYHISSILLQARYDDQGEMIAAKAEWQGDSDITTITADIMDDHDPRWMNCPPFTTLKVGDIVRVGQFRLQAFGIDESLNVAYFRRVADDPNVQLDSDGWIKG
jgi:hypothetical protein